MKPARGWLSRHNPQRWRRGNHHLAPNGQTRRKGASLGDKRLDLAIIQAHDEFLPRERLGCIRPTQQLDNLGRCGITGLPVQCHDLPGIHAVLGQFLVRTCLRRCTPRQQGQSRQHEKRQKAHDLFASTSCDGFGSLRAQVFLAQNLELV